MAGNAPEAPTRSLKGLLIWNAVVLVGIAALCLLSWKTKPRLLWKFSDQLQTWGQVALPEGYRAFGVVQRIELLTHSAALGQENVPAPALLMQPKDKYAAGIFVPASVLNVPKTGQVKLNLAFSASSEGALYCDFLYPNEVDKTAAQQSAIVIPPNPGGRVITKEIGPYVARVLQERGLRVLTMGPEVSLIEIAAFDVTALGSWKSQ